MHPELAPETEDLNVLGIRDIDLQYRRDAHVGLYTHPHFHNGTYWPESIGTEDASVPEYVGLEMRDTLNREQRLVYDTVIGNSQQDRADQLLLQIDGGGGTGKSYLINILAAHLSQASSIGEDPVDITVPTGAGSGNIRGKTIHSLLRLPVDKKFEPLTTAVLAEAQKRLRHLKISHHRRKEHVGPSNSWLDSPVYAKSFLGVSNSLVGSM